MEELRIMILGFEYRRAASIVSSKVMAEAEPLLFSLVRPRAFPKPRLRTREVDMLHPFPAFAPQSPDISVLKGRVLKGRVLV